MGGYSKLCLRFCHQQVLYLATTIFILELKLAKGAFKIKFLSVDQRANVPLNRPFPHHDARVISLQAYLRCSLSSVCARQVRWPQLAVYDKNHRSMFFDWEISTISSSATNRDSGLQPSLGETHHQPNNSRECLSALIAIDKKLEHLRALAVR